MIYRGPKAAFDLLKHI